MKGWTVKLLEDIPQAEYKKGYWLSSWLDGPQKREFEFAEGLYIAFNTEADARRVSGYLRDEGEIETEVVKVP